MTQRGRSAHGSTATQIDFFGEAISPSNDFASLPTPNVFGKEGVCQRCPAFIGLTLGTACIAASRHDTMMRRTVDGIQESVRIGLTVVDRNLRYGSLVLPTMSVAPVVGSADERAAAEVTRFNRYLQEINGRLSACDGGLPRDEYLRLTEQYSAVWESFYDDQATSMPDLSVRSLAHFASLRTTDHLIRTAPDFPLQCRVLTRIDSIIAA